MQVKSNATIYYVKPTATGLGNASSWANAIGSIQSVLNIAHSGDQIWVASGSYLAPAVVSGPTTFNSFVLKFDGVEIYGGFVGTETLLSQRNYELNETKLVGNGNVVLKSYVTLTRNTKLDGFSFINGSSTTTTEMAGAIDINFSSSPTIQHCKFYNNTSTNKGGAITVANTASPLILDCIFYNNTGTNGGAICIEYYSNPIILNCSFYNNTATSGNGDAIFISSNVQAGKISKIYNSIIYGNGTNEIYESTPGYLTVDYSNIKGGYSGTGNINADPKFVNPSAGNLKLTYNSPSVQSGDNNSYNALANINTSLDLSGNIRLSANSAGTGSIIDMGAYQFVPIAPSSVNYTSPNFFTANISSVNLIPTTDGTPPLTYTIDQILPVGLTFNTNTGAITGTPSQVFSPTVFTVSTSNSMGTASTTVHITVNDRLPNLSYTSPVVYTTGETISPTLSPLNSGGAVTGGLIAKQSSETLAYNGIAGMVMDNVGNFYLLSDVAHVIYKKTPSGVVTQFASGFLGGNAIAIDPNNILYVTTNTQILKVDIGGNVSTLTQNGNLSYAQGIKYG
ncbi:MAG: right-handed parallel beta-helix repeat-containing protein, partial [Sediminibacterium sp.]